MIADDIVRDKIKDIVSGSVLFNEPMFRHTSMGVGGDADIYISPASLEELKNSIMCLVEYEIPFFPVGNCTNLIVRDGGYRGAVISLRDLKNIEMKKSQSGNAIIFAEAGVSLSKLVEVAIRESLSGIEFCAGIPGSVGGGLRMNAGAYGSELKDIVAEISFVNSNGSIRNVQREDLRFEYRNLIMPKGTIIVSAQFKLQQGAGDEIHQKVSEIIATRKKKHPLGYRNAGSIFKNPKNMPAGKIIDDLGLKGVQIGDAQISDVHGNFIVNLGSAKAQDVVQLIDVVIQRVRKEKNIILEPEVKIIGED